LYSAKWPILYRIVAKPHAAKGELDLTILDATTSYAVPHARVSWGLIGDEVADPLPNSAPADRFGLLRQHLPAACYALQVDAPGYVRARSYMEVSPEGKAACQ
jgi:hypothetical protein